MLSSATSPENNISFNRAWQRLLLQILAHGKTVAPRGQETRELLANRITFDAARPVITVAERKLGYRFLCAEAAWIMDGQNRVETIAPYSREISRFSDDGVIFYGAYGPKIRDQLDYVVNTLASDASSRQAVISIWRENPPQTRDVPCTVSLQFIRRDMGLHCIASMRSSDAWLGVPYDGFNFSMLTLGLLLELRAATPGWHDVGLGTTTLLLGSSHLYARNFEGARDCALSQSYLQQSGRSVGADGIYVHCSHEEVKSWSVLTEQLWALARRDGSHKKFALSEILELQP